MKVKGVDRERGLRQPSCAGSDESPAAVVLSTEYLSRLLMTLPGVVTAPENSHGDDSLRLVRTSDSCQLELGGGRYQATRSRPAPDASGDRHGRYGSAESCAVRHDRAYVRGGVQHLVLRPHKIKDPPRQKSACARSARSSSNGWLVAPLTQRSPIPCPQSRRSGA